MAKSVKVKLNDAGVKEILNSQEVIDEVEDAVGPALANLFATLYPGTEWEHDTRQVNGRKAVIITNDDVATRFREAETGRIRKQMRKKV